MATHSNTLAWKIPWMEEPGRLQFMGSQRVGHDHQSGGFLSPGTELGPPGFGELLPPAGWRPGRPPDTPEPPGLRRPSAEVEQLGSSADQSSPTRGLFPLEAEP